MKKFGNKTKTKTAPRERFEFVFLRDEEPETHTFQIVIRPDLAGLARILSLVNQQPEQAMEPMLGLIRRSLDNTDGTPFGWQPTPIQDTVAGPDEEKRPVMLRAPYGPDKGDLVPFSRAAEYQAFDAGSSRRRWNALLDDDEIALEQGDLMELFEWIVGLAAGRPTEPSS